MPELLTFLAVPVLPPTRKPGIAACVAVPRPAGPFFSVTDSSAPRRARAVLSDITLHTSCGLHSSYTEPSAAMMLSIRRGFMRRPLLAMVAYTMAMCRGETDTE